MIVRLKKIIGILVITLTVLAFFHLASAQQARKIPRIGFFGQGKPFLYKVRIKALQQGLSEFGYVEGQNIRFEYRYADGKMDRLPSLATELVGLEVDVMITTGTPSTRAAKRASNTISIVMHGGDPVGTGLVASLAHPGGNITGLTIYPGPEFYGQRLELLKEVAPSASQFAVLLNPANSSHHLALKELQAAATGLSVTLLPLEVKGPEDIERAFDLMRKERPGAMLNLGDSVFNAHRKRIAAFAIENRIPAITPTNDMWKLAV
jgi:putative ABC transport system substrate-binding protein